MSVKRKGLFGVLITASIIALIASMATAEDKQPSEGDKAAAVAPAATQDKPAEETKAAVEAPKAEVQEPAADDKVAVVNGTVITKAAFDEEVNRVKHWLSTRGQTPGDDEFVKIKQEVIEKMVGRELLSQESKKQGIKIEDAAVEAQVDETKKRFPSEDEFKKRMELLKISEADLRNQIRQGMAMQQLIEKNVVEKITVSDDEIKEHYKNNPDSFKQPAQVKASHILIKLAPEMKDEEKAQAHKKLEGIQERVKKGEDFAALAKEFSDCPSKEKGGDLGFFGHGQMVKPFEDAAFALKANEVSDIIETQFGYHLIKVAEQKPETVIALDTIKDSLAKYLKQEKVESEVEKYVNGLKAQGKVEVFIK